MPLNRLLDPTDIAKLSNLELKARAAVEGFLVGLHQSPFHGFSVEFSQHRPYAAGDPLRYLDYKVLARTERYYIKQFEAETNLRAYILLDQSASMGYGSAEVNKWEYGTVLAAALGLLLLKQRDAVGLITYSKGYQEQLPPRSIMGWLQPLVATLDKLRPSGRTETSSSLLYVAEKVRRKGLVIVISDLLDDADQTIAAMKGIRHIGHELIVFHILDPMERTFAFPRDARFQDLETDEQLPSRPWHIRREYQREVEKFIEEYHRKCSRERIDYKLFTTDTPYALALYEFLAKRNRIL